MGVGKTKEKVKEMAFAVVRTEVAGRNQSMVLRWMANEKAGDDWYYRFMGRHPRLSLRKPEKLSHSRAVMENKAVINHYYTVLENLMKKHDLARYRELILNCDETGMPPDFLPSKVVSPKNPKMSGPYKVRTRATSRLWAVLVLQGTPWIP